LPRSIARLKIAVRDVTLAELEQGKKSLKPQVYERKRAELLSERIYRLDFEEAAERTVDELLDGLERNHGAVARPLAFPVMRISSPTLAGCATSTSPASEPSSSRSV
jgi:predicted nucleic acid-binding protein